MNQELYHEIEKYIHHIEWYSDFDIYLIHLNLNIDIYHYGTNVLLYKYYYVYNDRIIKEYIYGYNY